MEGVKTTLLEFDVFSDVETDSHFTQVFLEQSKFLKEVERDKKQGDTEAASAGARVLRYYLEFSRDAKKIQKVN